MLNRLEMAPPDPILGLTEAFNQDPNPAKINLGAGIYKDETGKTPVLASVKKAEERLLRGEATKSYLPIGGSPEYARCVQELVFGADSAFLASQRVATAHTPGGTGALRLAAEFLLRVCGVARIHVSTPTWENHRNIFQAAGLEIAGYPYYDAAARALDLDGMLAAVGRMEAGEALLLHGCCHNPSGMDPDPAQWAAIARAAADRGVILLVDLAYQGLGHGLEADAAGTRILCESGCEVLVASSFSKNFGLYSERVGALTVLAGDREAALRAFSHVKAVIRAIWSNPPSHGGAIVNTILRDPELRREWEGEVRAIRERINQMRRLFVETMRAEGVERDFSFITRQNGMFSFAGLDAVQVDRLRREFAIYVVGSGRINVASMTPANMQPLCRALAQVLKG